MMSACSTAANPSDGLNLDDGLPADSDPVPGATESQGSDVPEAQVESMAGSVQAPEFPLGLDWLNTERPLTMEQLRGKLVLLDFWTYGCINCIHLIPQLKQLEREYPDELVVIGVHSAKFQNEQDTENIRQIVLRYDLEHPIVNDRDFIIWQMWGANAWPTVVLIDPAGNIVGGQSGEYIYPLVQPIIEALIVEFDEKGSLDRTPLDLKLEKEGLPSTVLSFPGKVLVDSENERLFIADTNHHRIVVAHIESGEVLQVIGSGRSGFKDGNLQQAEFQNPQGMAYSSDNDVLYVADTENHAIRVVALEEGTVSTLAGTGNQASSYPPESGNASYIALNSPWDLELQGTNLYIAMAGSHQIWVLDLEERYLEPFAGSGREGTLNTDRLSATLAQPSGLALGQDDRLYFADSESSAIRWVGLTETEAIVDLLAGSDVNLFDFGDRDEVGVEARFQHPLGVVTHRDWLYVADTYNSKIKLVDLSTTEVITLVGHGHGWRDGEDPLFYEPGGLDFAQGKLYIADTNNHAVRVFDLASGMTSTLVLKGVENFIELEAGSTWDNIVREDEPLEIKAGRGSIQLDVELPPGYKLNELAPASMSWTTDGSRLMTVEDASWTIVGPGLPVESTTEFFTGEGVLYGELTLYYCEAEKESLCLIDQVIFEIPVQIGETGESAITLEYKIELPEDL
jgi:DNA-binding beta-propeller fold protein YncE